MSGEVTCRILKDGREIYSSQKRGIAPIISFIEDGGDAKGSTVYDKIVGKAAALLYALMGVKEVCAEVLSEKAESVLKRHKIAYSFRQKVPYIVNRKGDGTCPMEKAVENIYSPEGALTVLKEELERLRQQA